MINKHALIFSKLIVIIIIAIGIKFGYDMAYIGYDSVVDCNNRVFIESKEEMQQAINSSYGTSMDVIVYGEVVNTGSHVGSELSSIIESIPNTKKVVYFGANFKEYDKKSKDVDLVSLRERLADMECLGVYTSCEHLLKEDDEYYWEPCKECSLLETDEVEIFGVNSTLEDLDLDFSINSKYESFYNGWRSLNILGFDSKVAGVAEPINYVVESHNTRYCYYVLAKQYGSVCMHIENGTAKVSSHFYLDATPEQVVSNIIFGEGLFIVIFELIFGLLWIKFIITRARVISYNIADKYTSKFIKQKVSLTKN